MEIKVEIHEGDILAVYAKFAEGKSARTVEICPDECLVDLDESGKILGIEFLAPGELRLQTYKQLAREKCPYPDLDELFQSLGEGFVSVCASFAPHKDKVHG